MKKEKIESKKEEKFPEDQLNELTELLQRTQANFENYRKQQEKRIQEIQSQANKDLILQLLTVLDNFELALRNTKNPQDFTKGIELIHSQLFTLLENCGLKPIKTKNQVFNPYTHEALLKTNSDKPENIILEELQKGFTLNDQVIRHAKVKISAGNKKNETVANIASERSCSSLDEAGTVSPQDAHRKLRERDGFTNNNQNNTEENKK